MRSLILEDVASSISWKAFENLASEILKGNNFIVRKNFRFKTKRRYEIDLIATRGRTVLYIDCKQWRQGRNKKYAVVKAIKEQETRDNELFKFLKKNRAIAKELNISNNSKFHPMIITLLQEDVIKESNTFVVPIQKLNFFLLEIESYL